MSENAFLPQLGAALLRGLSIGMAVKASAAATDADVLAADRLPHDLHTGLADVLGGAAQQMEAVKAMDALLDRHPVLKPLEPFLFDMVMLKIIQDGTEREGDDFLDSPEMIALEEKTLDRGSELLNLLVYLRDCHQNEIAPNLSDFLNEFLLIEEEDFEDEFFIYEDVIRHQGLVKGTLPQIVEAGNDVDAPEMALIFTPMMAFFCDSLPKGDETLVALSKASPDPELHGAVYAVLIRFQSL